MVSNEAFFPSFFSEIPSAIDANKDPSLLYNISYSAGKIFQKNL